jgi:hypothetical protein
VIDNEMNGFHIRLGCHGQIGLDDDRYHSTVLRHEGHVEADMAALNRPAARDPLQNSGNLFVRNLRILGTAGPVCSCQESLAERTGDDEAGCGGNAGPEERSAG